MIKTTKHIILIVTLLALTISAQDKGKANLPEPLSPIPLTAAEAQPLRDAFTNEQMAQLALGKARAERQAAFYKFCADHALKPEEWEIRPDNEQSYVAIHTKKGGTK